MSVWRGLFEVPGRLAVLCGFGCGGIDEIFVPDQYCLAIESAQEGALVQIFLRLGVRHAQ